MFKLQFVPVVGALLAVLVPCVTKADYTVSSKIEPTTTHERSASIITQVIEDYHYRHPRMDDALSAAVLSRYLAVLDPERRFLLQSDVDALEVHSTRIDDYLRESDLQPIFDIFAQVTQRQVERTSYAIKLLGSPFDFSRDETHEIARDSAAWARDTAELDELWRKIVKNDVLSLRIAGKNAAAIESTLTARYEAMARGNSVLSADDVFERFINAYLFAIDSQTVYIGPQTTDKFEHAMNRSLVGVGMTLQRDEDRTFIFGIVPGGPADRSGEVHIGDSIVAVGSSADGPMTDVVGWRLDDVIDLIRGPKNTMVRLEVMPTDVGPGGPTKLVAIERDTVRLDELSAAFSVINSAADVEPVKIGVIEIPAFYRDTAAGSSGSDDGRSTIRDVARLLRDARGANISGLIVDLRGNGGGSLFDAVQLTGLFIDRGPVVQVKDSRGKVTVESDPDRGALYDGPLAVVVDYGSAGSSEIFAGSIQDYRRGFVVGARTYGHGTVQNFIDLNRFDRDMNGRLGHLKATIGQFFRVDGSGIQSKGVEPDIVLLPAEYSVGFAKASIANRLPWSSIESTAFRILNWDTDRFAHIRDLHERRMANDPALLAMVARAKAAHAVDAQETVSLMESSRRAAHEEKLRIKHQSDARMSPASGAGSAMPAIGDREYDVWLEETARILRDYVAGA